MKFPTILILSFIAIWLSCGDSQSNLDSLEEEEFVSKLENVNSIDSSEIDESDIIKPVDEKNTRSLQITVPNETEACDCEFLINWKYLDEVILFDSLGNEIEVLGNDSQNENYLIGRISQSDSSKFKAEIKYAQGDSIFKGYLNKAEYLGFFLSNYSNDTVDVFERLEEGMEYSNQIVEYDPSFFELLDCRKGWAKIAKERRSMGWIMNHHACASPYTTCN